MGPIRKIFVVATAIAVLVLGSATGGAECHAGYYYPEPTSVETYVARAVTLRSAGREMRIGFVTGMTAQQMTAAYPRSSRSLPKGNRRRSS